MFILLTIIGIIAYLFLGATMSSYIERVRNRDLDELEWLLVATLWPTVVLAWILKSPSKMLANWLYNRINR
jgi:hypothetical protein